ncbi:hypothetical protein [Phenylobacterium sp.]|jgi:hypothetical protein|uniref:hypothetical protein n=1 Tax=Phenylobacterium sp. TaxID=1871053 RepID=UPI0037CA406B
MVAYQFEPRHHDAILDGSKPFTLRASQKKRHAKISEEIQFLPGRAKPKFAIGECVYRATVTLSDHGLMNIANVEALGVAGAAIDRMFQCARCGAPQARAYLEIFAAVDGFTTWADLVRWHAEQGEPDAGGLIVREVIGWTDATAVKTTP